ncbi:MAG: phage tail assembly chaperone [Rhodobacteraceae bacterium]|nr:phage tail assembly chaperone [Paracoccaceae bacterium]
MTRIAWPRLMQVGLGRLRLPPEVFWNLTPAEFMLMAGLGEGRAALSRAGLAELSARFPDVPAVRPAELE